MNWLKENPVIAAIAVVALIGTAVTGFFAVKEAARLEQAVLSWNKEAAALRELESKKPYPNPTNFQTLQSTVNAYENAITGFIQKLSDIDNKIEPASTPTPQEFQDELRKSVTEVLNEAENKVALPEKFYLGFEAYQSQLPTQDEVNKLNREFQVIKGLVSAIIPLGINSIDTLIRHPSANPPAPVPDTKAPPAKAAQPAPEPIRFDSFTLGITAPQNSFIRVFDKIPDSPGFLVVRSLIIENTSPTPPPKTALSHPISGAPPAAALKPATSDKLPMLFGSEAVKVTILFEIPDFPENPAPPQTSTPEQN